MKWLVQKNFTEKHFEKFINSLERLNCDVIYCHMFPFVDKIFDTSITIKEIDTVAELVIPCTELVVGVGSIKLGRVLNERGVKPGAFATDQFNFQTWSQGFGIENILNNDTRISKLKDLSWNLKEENVFIRPVEDDKSFSGMVKSVEFLKDWQETILNFEENTSMLNGETLISIASVKEIFAEYRCFIVNKKVVSASRYKLGSTVLYSEIVDESVIDFAQTMSEHWEPAEAFVLDIAETPNGLKIIEINGFGGSGFYACDTQKIISAIEKLYE